MFLISNKSDSALTLGTFCCQWAARGLASAGLALLAGCGALGSLNTAPLRPVPYDFGSGASVEREAGAAATQRPVALADVDAPAALDSPAVLYRLAYTDAQQLRPYAQARWSMAPAQLLRLRLREGLGQNRAVLQPGEGGRVRLLRVELEEFSQVFETPQRSHGLVRLRATVTDAAPAAGETLVAQRTIVARRPAPSPDAPGGVHALAAAADAAIATLGEWLDRLP